MSKIHPMLEQMFISKKIKKYPVIIVFRNDVIPQELKRLKFKMLADNLYVGKLSEVNIRLVAENEDIIMIEPDLDVEILSNY